jgi:hypothetical protein
MRRRIDLLRWPVKRPTELVRIGCHPERGSLTRASQAAQVEGSLYLAGIAPVKAYRARVPHPSRFCLGGNQNLPHRLDEHRRPVRQYFCHSLHDFSRIITRTHDRVSA